jgi:hypothetical protein
LFYCCVRLSAYLRDKDLKPCRVSAAVARLHSALAVPAASPPVHPRVVHAWCHYLAVAAAGPEATRELLALLHALAWEAHRGPAERRSCELLELQARASAQADVVEGGAAPLPLQPAWGARWLLLRACALRTAWAAEAAAAPAGGLDAAVKAAAVEEAGKLQSLNLLRTRSGTQPGWV